MLLIAVLVAQLGSACGMLADRSDGLEVPEAEDHADSGG